METKCDIHTGFLDHSTRDLLDHLLVTYGRITPTALAENLKRFQAAIDPDTPLETYFKTLEDCLQYADDGKAPYSEALTIQTELYTFVEI